MAQERAIMLVAVVVGIAKVMGITGCSDGRYGGADGDSINCSSVGVDAKSYGSGYRNKLCVYVVIGRLQWWRLGGVGCNNAGGGGGDGVG